MIESRAVEEMDAMTVPEFKAILKRAMYSEENLAKLVVKLMMLIDPEAINDMAEWVNSLPQRC